MSRASEGLDVRRHSSAGESRTVGRVFAFHRRFIRISGRVECGARSTGSASAGSEQLPARAGRIPVGGVQRDFRAVSDQFRGSFAKFQWGGGFRGIFEQFRFNEGAVSIAF